MDKLTTHDKVKLQNILNYYTEYRKTNYDDNIGITIENQRREEEKKNIDREIQKIKIIKRTEEYVSLHKEKCIIHQQILMFERRINKNKKNPNNTIELNKIYETLDGLYKSIETIENKQLETIKTEGVNTDLLGDNIINDLL